MPLFRRSDGTLVRDLPPMRRILPYLMRRRNESAVYIDMRLDVTRTRRWMRAFNRASKTEPCTTLHLFVFVLSHVVVEYPELNRFISGRRIYQRNAAGVALVVRESLEPGAPPYTVKLPAAEPGLPLTEFSRRIAALIRDARERQRTVEREVELVMRLPDPLVRLAVWAREQLDAWNLLPEFMIRDDPMYTTLFIAEVKSMRMPAAFHHLHELGTCGMFAVIAARERDEVPGNGQPGGARDILPIRWTIDERIADGLLMATALQQIRRWMEDPAQLLGPPEEAARNKTCGAAADMPAPAVSWSGP